MEKKNKTGVSPEMNSTSLKITIKNKLNKRGVHKNKVK